MAQSALCHGREESGEGCALQSMAESTSRFAPVWDGLTKQFEVLAIDLPGFGRSEARDDLFAPKKMGRLHRSDRCVWAHIGHARWTDVDRRRVLFAALMRQNSSAASSWCRRTVYPVDVDGALKWMIEAERAPSYRPRSSAAS